jgi:hypothetical protein
MSTTKVPVGVTSVAGYSSSLVLFVLAIYSFAFNNDRTDQTLGTLAAGAAAALTFLSTQVGRYVQAKELAKTPLVIHQPVPVTPNPQVELSADDDLDPEPPVGPDPSAAFPSLDEPEGKSVTRTDVLPVTTHDHLDG